MDKAVSVELVSSVTIGILNKVNELATRYGLMASNIDAIFYDDANIGRVVLKFIVAPTEDEKYEAFEKMLVSLGIRPEEGQLIALSAADVECALDDAIRRAPRARRR